MTNAEQNYFRTCLEVNPSTDGGRYDRNAPEWIRLAIQSRSLESEPIWQSRRSKMFRVSNFDRSTTTKNRWLCARQLFVCPSDSRTIKFPNLAVRTTNQCRLCTVCKCEWPGEPCECVCECAHTLIGIRASFHYRAPSLLVNRKPVNACWAEVKANESSKLVLSRSPNTIRTDWALCKRVAAYLISGCDCRRLVERRAEEKASRKERQGEPESEKKEDDAIRGQWKKPCRCNVFFVATPCLLCDAQLNANQFGQFEKKVLFCCFAADLLWLSLTLNNRFDRSLNRVRSASDTGSELKKCVSSRDVWSEGKIIVAQLKLIWNEQFADQSNTWTPFNERQNVNCQWAFDIALNMRRNQRIREHFSAFPSAWYALYPFFFFRSNENRKLSDVRSLSIDLFCLISRNSVCVCVCVFGPLPFLEHDEQEERRVRVVKVLFHGTWRSETKERKKEGQRVITDQPIDRNLETKANASVRVIRCYCANVVCLNFGLMHDKVKSEKVKGWL